ncbi:hypothetical protein AB0N09_05930 [Streptomyces erythrochromogenes]|uniref:hypothetical protein n=1 Tax=Streptomyces erythrochromogenes TaxID=285574 RepID=UPI003426E7C0
MKRTTTDAAAHARRRIVTDMSYALTLPPQDRAVFMASYLDTVSDLADQCADPDAAYRVLCDFADDTYEDLVEGAEAALAG